MKIHQPRIVLNLCSISGLETFRKSLDVAEPGDQLGILLRGVESKAVRRGSVLLPQDHKHVPTDKVEAQVVKNYSMHNFVGI